MTKPQQKRYVENLDRMINKLLSRNDCQTACRLLITEKMTTLLSLEGKR